MYRLLHIILYACLLSSCGHPDTDEELAHKHLKAALSLLDQDEERISLPKTPYPVSTAARLKAVDAALASPGQTLFIGRSLKDTVIQSINNTQRIENILRILSINSSEYSVNNFDGKNITHITGDKEFDSIVHKLNLVSDYYKRSVPDVYKKPPAELLDLISASIVNRDDNRDVRWLNTEPVHRVGRSSDLNFEATILAQYLNILSQYQFDPSNLPEGTWDTPNGRIRIAGIDNDHHEGAYLMLIDKGGDDTYSNIHNPVLNSYQIVIDLAGNDRVTWTDTYGPGTGVFGTGIWLDYKGNDIYQGNNDGIGTGIFGTGYFYDAEGDDQYTAGSFVSGAGLYGIGIHIDDAGDDKYVADFSSQGYGASGGIGIMLDTAGNDHYECKPVLADLVKNRKNRYKEKHFVNMCQGYAFGRRPDYSGGIGLLIDSSGDDVYKVDIFGQGGAYWYGLGLLIDSNGNDQYFAHTHAQGEALHLAAGFLFDYQGNDVYNAYELAQGTGVDRSIGLLYDAQGDDYYRSNNESQGAGIKPYGTGILLDMSGNDAYEANSRSQGYTWMPTKFPSYQQPMAILIDINGENRFSLPRPYILKEREFTDNAVATEY